MELGILPFWFWNGELKKKELEWQMREYKDKGIQGLFIHGRFGLKVPYLSNAWFEKVKYVVEKAKDIGLDMWIYDEMNWPSGTAERQVLKKYPYLSQKYLELVILNVYGPLFTFLEASDDRYINTGNAKPIAAFACSMDEFDNGIKDLIDLTPNLSFDKVIPWEAPPGKWKLLYFLEKEADYYIDALDPESTNRFIELTHERYKEAVGKDFSTIVPGFYTDEPAMHYYHVGMDNYVIPWSNKMFKIFRERRGYDLKPNLVALFTHMGERTATIGYDFWRTLTEQYSETYFKRIRDWCDENNVIFTGHLLGEDWMRMHARCEGNIFKHLQHMHLTGVDHLYPVIGTEETPSEHVALKLASSAAHFYGSARLLCESMGGTYWDCTLERMKWIANWEYVLGVTIFNNHGYHYSIEGERKRDWPPSQFYHHTWWKYYNCFTKYMARLGHILSGGRHVANILMIYPINSTWTNYVPQRRDAIGNVIEQEFYYLTDTLLRLHFDYDYVDEDILSGAKIENGLIKIANEEYSVLVLPPMTHIKKTTFDKIKKFVRGGGHVIADTLLPAEFLETSNNNATKEVEAVFGLKPQKVLADFNDGTRFAIHKKDNVYVIQGKGLRTAGKSEDLSQILEGCIEPDVKISNKNIFYLHRVKDYHDIYFFVNTLQEDQGGVDISFQKIGQPELWDPVTGAINPLHVYHIEQDRLCIQLNFPATTSHLVIFKKGIETPYIAETNMSIEQFDGHTIRGHTNTNSAEVYAHVHTKKGKQIYKHKSKKTLPHISLGKEYKFDIEDDNVLCLSKWKMKVMDKWDNEKQIIKPDFNDKEWLDVTMGAWEMQLPFERDEACYPETLWYRAFFNMDHIPTAVHLLIDGFSGKKYRLYINGVELKGKGKRSKLDAEIRSVDIKPFVIAGRNVIAIKLIVTRRTDGILDLLKITGDFALAKQGEEYKIVKKRKKMKIGDWTKHGYPYYSGTGVYQKEIHLPAEYLNGKLFLCASCGEDVLELVVNDKQPVVIPWHPYRVDISNYAQPGKNKIILKVTNTLVNMLEAVQKESGLVLEPYIEHEHIYTLFV
jgi:hypothetical protein